MHAPIIREIMAVLAEHDGIELAVLFGSIARSEHDEGSDVDLGLKTEPGQSAARDAVEIALGRAMGREIDLVDLDIAPPHLRFEIARDGLLLVENRTHAWADYRARAMLDWWEWQPWAQSMHETLIERLRAKAPDGAR